MHIQTNSLYSIVSNNLNVVKNMYPVIYRWLSENARKIGMHPLKAKRELRKAIRRGIGLERIDLNSTRLVRC